MTGTRRLPALLVALLVCAAGLLTLTPGVSQAATYVPVSGAGSTWSQNAIEQWRRNVNQYGLTVNYQGTGSSDGRNQFRNGTVDFAVSEIPYGLKDGTVFDTPPARGYAYMPIVAGGTSFMYNLKIGGRRVTNLRLSGENLAKIFTGVITTWNDPALAADNPGLKLPGRRIVPVVRSDGSGTTAQLTTYFSKRQQGLWDDYCKKAGRTTPCGVTSNYPTVAGKGFVAQSGSLGVSGYVSQAQSEGAITYVEYSYALEADFPVVKVKNDAGYYNEPTASNVAVALLKASINTDASSPAYLTQQLEGVYGNTDPRTYPLSSYSYMIIPTRAEGTFNNAKGKALGDFAYYFLCEGQQQAPDLGFSPLPINLVQAGLTQVRKIPGVDAKTIDIKTCRNPTFSASGQNTLAAQAPQPPACDKAGTLQCSTGTGGAKAVTTPTSGGSAAGGGSVVGGTSGGSAATTGSGTVAGAGTSGGVVAGSGSAAGTSGGVAGSAGGGTPVTVVDPVTGETTVVSDPTGSIAASGGTGGATVVDAQAVSLTQRGDGLGLPLLATLGVLVLLAVIALPPLLSRRLAGGRGAAGPGTAA